MNLVAHLIETDDSIRHCKEKLLEKVLAHQKELTSVRPPQEGLKVEYDEMIQHLGQMRGGPLFYPLIGSGAGNGALVELADGSVKYDFISGIGVHFGHSHPTILRACIEGALENIPMQGNLMQNRHTLPFTRLMTQHSGMDHCFLTTSGAMANENGLKLLFHHKRGAERVLAFEKCFMGRTLTLSQVTDKAIYREGLPSNLHVDYIPFYDWQKPEESTERAVNMLRTYLARYPGKHACFCMELIQGEGGFRAGKAAFFQALIAILKEHDIALFVDEVQTFGRTSALFAYQYYGLAPDVVTVGKLSQVCCTLFQNKWKPKPGLISQTFIGASTQIRCGYAIVHSLVEEGYLGEQGINMQIRRHFVQHLQRLEEKHPTLFQGPYGEGLMIAFTPFGGDPKRCIAAIKALFHAGVICFVAGVQPTRIRFLVPAGGVTFDDIDRVAHILEETLVQL